ncbi:MAG: hypothetical protein ABWZ75_08790 [Novosphingobium sp.]
MNTSAININPGHLREIGVALDGSLVALGSMDYPEDVTGHFPCPDAEFVRISRVDGLRIVRCRAFRETSGFLCAEEYGPELHVPASLAAIVERALRLGAKQAVQASLNYQDGELRSSTSRVKTLHQPLSCWTLNLDEVGGGVNVVLSARLHGSVIPEWSTSTANYWPAELDLSLKVEFRIDPITRVACFGAHVPTLEKEPATPASVPMVRSLASLDVADAPVGTFAQFAMGGTRWYSLYEGEASRYLSITEHAPPTRTPIGLLNDNGSYRWPRISIHGIDMRAVASMLRQSNNFRSSVTSSTVGEAYRSFGSDGSETYFIADLALDFRLDTEGLHIRINGKTQREAIALDLLLIWETLILRFPYYTRFIKALVLESRN